VPTGHETYKDVCETLLESHTSGRAEPCEFQMDGGSTAVITAQIKPEVNLVTWRSLDDEECRALVGAYGIIAAARCCWER